MKVTEGAALLPPGDGRLFIAAPAGVEGRTATCGVGIADGLPAVARIEDLSAIARTTGGAELVLLADDAVRRLEQRGGEWAVRLAVAALRRRVAPGLVAAQPSPAGPYDRRGADVVLVPLESRTADAARLALEAGIRAAGRPVLVDVRSSDVDADQIVAAVDGGATGAVLDTGDAAADAALARAVLDREARRFDGAPLISVVVCSYNGAEDLDPCLDSLERLEYPNYEVVVVDDGSKDDSVAIARRHAVRVVEREGGGLSRARNAGLAAAAGEVVVFMDQDAEATPAWLGRLWRLMDRLGADGATGPNLPFPDAAWEERVVSGAPGAAIPVVHDDGTCTHMAGCNMAFRRDRALAVGGFNPGIRAAGDDVEFCLRMVAAGSTLAFQPQAVIHHHRRDVKGYIRQQRSYVRSEVTAAARRSAAPGPANGDAPPPDVYLRRRRSPLGRLNPLRPRYVFIGPQATQRFGLARQPLNSSLPGIGLLGLLCAAVGGLAPAWRLRRLGRWLVTCAAAVVAYTGAITARVPAYRPEPGLRGLAQRLGTAGLWLLYPLLRRSHRRAALRERPQDAAAPAGRRRGARLRKAMKVLATLCAGMSGGSLPGEVTGSDRRVLDGAGRAHVLAAPGERAPLERNTALAAPLAGPRA